MYTHMRLHTCENTEKEEKNVELPLQLHAIRQHNTIEYSAMHEDVTHLCVVVLTCEQIFTILKKETNLTINTS